MKSSTDHDLVSKFIGTWKLIECIEIDAHGNHSFPWGQDALGYLIYTKEGIMSVQIMRKNRSSDEANNIGKNYNAYFGHFTINESNTTVIHMVEGHLNPDFIGKKNIRIYSFRDNTLSLTAQGETASKRLLWQKL